MTTTTPQSIPLTSEAFPEFVRTHRFVVIHFWAAWNSFDHQMRQLLETQIPDDLREVVTFARFDVDPPEHHELCRQHNLRNVPFLAFYRDGFLVRSVTGMRPAGVITEYVGELVKGPVTELER